MLDSLFPFIDDIAYGTGADIIILCNSISAFAREPLIYDLFFDLRIYRCWQLLMINDRWLIAIAKCRQIARQMRPSRCIDAIVDVLFLVLTDLTDHLTASNVNLKPPHQIIS